MLKLETSNNLSMKILRASSVNEPTPFINDVYNLVRDTHVS